jgi:plasmid stability protein
MPSITITNIPEETLQALQIRAAKAGRNTNDEALLILENRLRPANRVKLGILLAEIGQIAGGADLLIERDKSPHEPLSL